MTPTDAVEYLHGLPRWATAGEPAYEPGLDRIRALLERMGRPQEGVSAVHVAGTNGKGSTAAMVAAIGTAYGERVGLHTSPHLRSVRERMRVDGEPAPPDWLAGAVERYRPLFEQVRPSFFEATFALSLAYFAEEEVDRAVVEVGMGGRLDATNVLEPELTLVTHVGLDHTAFLGETVEAIAREKAGILEPDVPVLVGTMPPEASAVIAEVAREKDAPFHAVRGEVTVRRSPDGGTMTAVTPEAVYPDLRPGLTGSHQIENARLALRTAELLYPAGERRRTAVEDGLARVRELARLRARMEVVQEEPAVIVDVAHNTESLQRTLGAIRARYLGEDGSLYVLLGVMRDKDVDGMVRLLAESGASVRPVELPGERAFGAGDLRDRLIEADVPVPAEEDAFTVQAGLSWYADRRGSEDVLLCTGSHRVAGAVLDLVEPVRTGS